MQTSPEVCELADLAAHAQQLQADRDLFLAGLADAEADRDRLSEALSIVSTQRDELLAALRNITAIGGLTDHEAERLSGREGWQAAMNAVYHKAQAAIARAEGR